MYTLKLEINEDIYPLVYNFLKLLSPSKIKIEEISYNDELLTHEDVAEYNNAIVEMKQNKTMKLSDYKKKRKLNV